MTLFLVALGALYFLGWYSQRARPKKESSWRPAPFAAGLTVAWIAVASPIAHLHHHLLTAHMVQHLVLMLLAAPLVLLGAPLNFLVHALPQRLGMICMHPAFCWLASSLTVIVWHVPAIFQLAWRSHAWHEFANATFSLAGILFWWPVIQAVRGIAKSRWAVPVYLFLATLPCDALSAFLVFCGHVVYRPYLSSHGPFHISPLEDQALAGALMWVTVTFAYLIPAIVVTSQLLSRDESVAAEVEVA